jgi:hypothetical protein
MLSFPQMCLALLLLAGLGGWWVARSLNRDDQEKQIEQALEALDRAYVYWTSKLSDPTVSTYAQTYVMCLDADRSEVMKMQTTLAVGERLTVKQLVRLDRLVSEHLADSSAPPVSGHAALPGH